MARNMGTEKLKLFISLIYIYVHTICPRVKFLQYIYIYIYIYKTTRKQNTIYIHRYKNIDFSNISFQKISFSL